ncbi:MAG: hypothetical protein J0H11_13665 [Rhizobiales bacterium]|nr:hypothetical protein [Hyphomicrobiales bacterium]
MTTVACLDLVLNEFTPAETEALTSLTPEMQREWRKRGYIRKFEKHARFDPLDVIEIAVLKMFADRGIGPHRATAWAHDVAGSVLCLALELRADAWAGGSPHDIVAQLPADATKYWPRGGTADRPLEAFEQRAWLARQVVNALGFDFEHVSTHVVMWPTDEIEFGRDGRFAIDLFPINNAESDRVNRRFDGPVIFLNLSVIAENLVIRSPKPLVAAELGCGDGKRLSLPWSPGLAANVSRRRFD